MLIATDPTQSAFGMVGISSISASFPQRGQLIRSLGLNLVDDRLDIVLSAKHEDRDRLFLEEGRLARCLNNLPSPSIVP